jgi:hypothetical protein
LEITGGKGVDVVYDPVVRSTHKSNSFISKAKHRALELIFFFHVWVFVGPDRTELEMRQVESQGRRRRLRSGDDREDPGEFDLVEEHLYRRRTLGSLYQ